MKLLTGSDLLLAGWQAGPQFAEMLAYVAELESRGIKDRDYALKLLRRDFPMPPAKLVLRSAAAPLSEAIEATCQADEENIGAVRRFMADLLRVPVIQRGAIMPDACPAGQATATIPVGGAVVVEGAIIPSAHSEDVCCSMYATFFQTDADVETQLDALMQSTRFGPGGRKPEDWVHHPVLDEPVWTNPFLQGLERHAAMHLADQGDGNHFAYLGEVSFSEEQCRMLEKAGHDELGRALAGQSGKWNVLVTHHGSRGLGAHVYKRGKNSAEKHTEKVASGVPTAACWLDFASTEGAAYWEALQYVGRWTKANHQCIHARFSERLGTRIAAAMGNEHNFVWKRDNMFYHGKGATPAWKDEMGRPQLGLIPLHMSAPILIVLGNDNDEFLGFAPHGAGRNISRKATLRPFWNEQGKIEDSVLHQMVAEQTQGISVRWWHGKADLSETPIGYKPAEQVKSQIAKFSLAHLVAEIRPLGCIMAGDGGPRPWERDKDLTPKQKRQIEHRADRRKTRQELLHIPDDEED